MKQTEEQTRARETVAKAIEKAWADESFKRHLLSNPLEAMKSLTGKRYEFPEGREIVFVDQEGDTPESTESIVYINIAERSDIEDLKLTDEQLEAVAGGQSIVPILLPVDLPIILLPSPPIIDLPRV